MLRLNNKFIRRFNTVNIFVFLFMPKNKVKEKEMWTFNLLPQTKLYKRKKIDFAIVYFPTNFDVG